MAPSKKWMNFVNDRLNEKYKAGVVEFLDYAFSKMGEVCEIQCPCVKYNNTDKGSREVVAMHLNVYGIMPNYIFWYHHGERRGEIESSDEEVDENESEEEINEVLQDFYPDYYGFDESGKETGSSSRTEQEDKPNEDVDAFYRLLKDVNQPTYPGCETSKLSALVKLLHIKSIGRWSNESFDMLLKMLKEILPTGSTLPETYYDSKKIIRDLELSYEKIDVCVNNCMLY
ncbi:uncharacterized protein LOC131013238 [Salvia miltiorrhiza]|uniref:uncharacterized protein LOC131013238 n=1 Tax=Salvia miltiorrhiza TaxID=226208 RepID=UPI0025AC1D81|nr:uncharacterized protein LOC131013238 [Salvia miltiorrhiza]